MEEITDLEKLRVTDLEKLRVGELYLIEVNMMESEYDEETDTELMVEKKYKFKGTYSGKSEPRLLDEDDHITTLSPEDMEYVYEFKPYQKREMSKIIERVNGKRRMRKVVNFVDPDPDDASFPLGIPLENALRISQRDVTEGKTKVYLSTDSKLSKEVHVANQFMRQKLGRPEKALDRAVSEYLGGKNKKKKTYRKRSTKKRLTKKRRN